VALSLSKKVLVVVTVPVIFELVLVGTLFSLLSKVEEARAKASHARELSSHLNAVMALTMRRGALIMVHNSVPEVPYKQDSQDLSTKVQKELELISKLVSNHAEERALWQIGLDSIKQVDSDLIEAQGLTHSSDKASAALVWARAQRNIQRIFKVCSKLVDDQDKLQSLNQTAIQNYDRDLQLALKLSVLLSILIAFGLATFINRSTVKRLHILTLNSRLLAIGQEPKNRLAGGDELAELDHIYQGVYHDLQILRQKERAILDNAAEIICSIDERFCINDINHVAEEILGYSAENLQGRRCLDLILPSEQRLIEEKFLLAIEEKSQVRFESNLVCANTSTITAAWSITWSDAERALFCVISDISERKNLERMKQDFVDMISHDLRTPLSAVLLSLDLVSSMKDSCSPEAAVYINRATKNLDLSLGLINQLLDLEKMESGLLSLTLDAISTHSIINEAVLTVTDLAKAKNLTIELPISNLELTADHARLVQVMINLLSNAIKFSKMGGTIAISADELENDVRIAVKDNGPGIELSQQEKIFDRFHQVIDSQPTKPSGDASVNQGERARVNSGSGLGLTICKAIVEAHNGRIGVISAVNQGCEIWFEIPN
jgi:PAS domain S-box-containing protein